MPLTHVDLEKQLSPIRWFLPDLLLSGYLNFVASLPGHGKTAMLSALAWQATRPDGGTFLDRRVAPGATLYVDYDAPGEGRSIRYWLAQHKNAYPSGDMNKIHVLEPDRDTFGMREGELEQVAKTAEETGAVLIIIDSFMAAFPGTNPSALTEVQGPLWYLRRLAEETGACVVLVDHLPKPLTGETAGARGVMGSVAKPAQSRAVHVLSAVPAKEVGGRKVLRWDVQKMSFGKLLEPFGVELEFDTRAHTVHVQTTDLPDTFAETKSDAAARAMQNYLEDNRNKPVPRKDLINVGIRGGGVGESTAKSALTQMLARLGDGVEEIVQAGKGAPKAYRLKPVGGDPPDVSNPLTQMGETPSQTNEHPGYTPLTEKDELTEIDDDERGYV